MREIVNIQVGQCGNQIGSKFWEVILEEHSINQDGRRITQETSTTTRENTNNKKNDDDYNLEKSNVYFNEGLQGRYVPRAILTDLEPGVMDSIRASHNGRLFKPDNIIYGNTGAGNNFAKGHYSEGAELCEVVLDVVRKEVENCDCLQGFQMSHSIGGGTGSGLGTLIYSKLKEEYHHNIFSAYSIFPSENVSDCVVEPYNSIFAMNYLIENCDENMMIGNEALFKICGKRFKIEKPTYGDLNFIIANAMSGVTSSLRFPGQLNSDLRKLAMNLVPFPRLNFLTIGLCPLFSRKNRDYSILGIPELIREIFDEQNILSSSNPMKGKYLTMSTIFRGKNISTYEVENNLMKKIKKNSKDFIEWIPDNVQTCVCNYPMKGISQSAVFLGNNTSICEVFNSIEEKFDIMFKRKAFLHWFSNEGMDELEMKEAQCNVRDLCSEYQQYQDAEVHEDFYE